MSMKGDATRCLEWQGKRNCSNQHGAHCRLAVRSGKVKGSAPMSTRCTADSLSGAAKGINRSTKHEVRCRLAVQSGRVKEIEAMSMKCAADSRSGAAR
ncbi:unnamed protein product [Cuscuta campestris]|uniref:Uncharacterized protein n=1 Tax=Cuscuta campestris TaxID=132261 RepID=A0A484LMM7_9ASTE|nr:unnamed protein product [Cuscuta campestris]